MATDKPDSDAEKTDEKTAEQNKKKVFDKFKGLTEVCTISIPAIVSALHAKAVKEAKPETMGAKIVNSAIEDDSGKGKESLKSAGEHIISVLPDKEGAVVKKDDAIKLLKTYVSWFVGPDLANKVDGSTVKSLTEDPLKESKIVMSFRDFLNEADESEEGESSEESSSEGSDEGNAKGDEEAGDSEAKPSEEGGNKPDEEKPGDENASNEEVESKFGYYVAYNLKVEGLKQTALKDAVTKFAKTFFDDVTFSGSGLFGGNYSFTVKDVKDKFKDAFGAIDPNDLVDKVEKELRTKFPKGSTCEVAVQDKDTLIADLEGQLDGQQKNKINSANYSLRVKVPNFESKKDILNPTMMADIVTSSIKGLFKKFKNKITKNDVVYIKNFNDDQYKPEKVQQIENMVPPIETFEKYIRKNATKPVDCFTFFDKEINKLQNKDKTLLDKTKKAKLVVKAWAEFKEKHNNEAAATASDSEEFFKPFMDFYRKNIGSKGGDKLDESMSILKMLANANFLKKMIFEDVCHRMKLNEDETEDSTKKSDDKTLVIDKSRLEKIQNIIKKRASKKFNTPFKCVVGTKDDIENAFEMYGKSKMEQAFAGFKYAIGLDFGDIEDKQANEKNKSTGEIKEDDNIRNDIMNILFESDSAWQKYLICEQSTKEFILQNNLTKEQALGEYFKQIRGITHKDDEKTKNIINNAFKKIEDEKNQKYEEKGDDTNASSYKTSDNKIPTSAEIDAFFNDADMKDAMEIDNIGKSTAFGIDGNDMAFVIPFSTSVGKGLSSEENSEKIDAQDDNNNGEDPKGKEDLYIIPMPGLKYQDKEYDTYA